MPPPGHALDEVKDRLKLLGTRLSGGQQQRLTLARALSHRPEVLCLDEFSIAIDPVTTMKIEDILRELKHETTIVLVTNSCSRPAAGGPHGLSQCGATDRGRRHGKLFTRPDRELTRRYVEGQFG